MREEDTYSRLSGMFGGEEECGDSFEKVSMAIQERFQRTKFPQLKTIRYADKLAGWEEILRGQYFDQYGPWGLERRLRELGIEFVDGTGVKWVQSVAGEQYVDEDEDEEEEYDEDENENGSDEEGEGEDLRE